MRALYSQVIGNYVDRKEVNNNDTDWVWRRRQHQQQLYCVCVWVFVLDIHDNDWKTVNNNKEIIIE